MTLRPLALALSLSLTLAACGGGQPPAPAATPAPAVATVTPAQRAEQLAQLYNDYWEASLQLNPLQSTFVGETRYNDQLPDFFSAEFRTRAEAFSKEWLAKVQAIGSEGLSGQDLISYEIFVREREQEIAGNRFPDWQMPLNQFTNLAGFFAQLGSGTSAQPFKTVKDYDNWLARAGQFPTLMDSLMASMREGMKSGVV